MSTTDTGTPRMPATTTSTEHGGGYNRRTFAHEQFNLVSGACA